MMLARTAAVVAASLLLGAGAASAQSSTATPSGDSAGRHSMDGQVTKVDAKKGWVDVKTSEGSMKLHFPPAALQNVKKGDSVTVELALKDNGPAASGASTSKQPKERTR
jgi:hypothetical protein